jgi:two-component system, OmpR family, response regulator MtrA
VTAVVEPPDLDGVTPDEVPLVVCVALDHGRRRRLATLLDGVGIVMFTEDVATAHSMLGRQITRNGTDAHPETGTSTVHAGDLQVDRPRCRVTWRGQPLPLTHRERDLLACLASGPARVWTYQQLYEAAWTGRYLDPGPVHAAVKRLRRKLQQAGVGLRIDAIRGVGYELVASDAS